RPAAAAAVFTPNAFAAAPVRLSRSHLAASAGGPDQVGDAAPGSGWASAVICTSGSANAATGAAGDADQAEIASALAGALGTTVERVLLLSTGIIGTRLPVERVREGIRRMAGRLGAGDDHLMAAAEAFRTTDTVAKVATTAVTVPDPDGLAVRPVRVTGIAKGVGMIHPRMATMLAVLMTDAPVAPSVLHGILRSAATRTWNQLTIDGDTSTNDTVFLLASGATDIAPVAPGSRALATIRGAVTAVARDLARQQAADGEGATTLITCQVSGAVDDMDARAVARAVVSSSLVKAAVHGRDPNWGRIAGAAGNARIAEPALLEAAGLSTTDARERTGQPVIVDPDRLRIAIGSHVVFDGGQGGPVAFDRDAARLEMDVPELLLRVDLGLGDGTGEAFGCDLTEAYVRENSEYTT
ncbi:MAG TPA: bifunctional ornithine acetyltransferase/N-acetylglutamate synthase, partial [Candidatus Limnocylindrales bacterium]